MSRTNLADNNLSRTLLEIISNFFVSQYKKTHKGREDKTMVLEQTIWQAK